MAITNGTVVGMVAIATGNHRVIQALLACSCGVCNSLAEVQCDWVAAAAVYARICQMIRLCKCGSRCRVCWDLAEA